MLLPVLASAYLPLATAANLPGELLRVRHFPWPLGVTLAVSMTAWGAGYALSRSPDKAALLSVVAAVCFSSLGWTVRTLEQAGADAAVGGVTGTIALYSVAVGATMAVIVGARRSVGGVVRYLTLMATLLVGWNAGNVIWRQHYAGEPPHARVAAEITAPAEPSEPAPDIYLLVLDKYTSSSLLASQYGFDNSAFEEDLRQRGFVVPAGARANYVHTFLALGAMLNVRYLDDLTARYGNNMRWDLAYPLVENNRMAAFLRDRGYRVVTFPTALGATRENRYADVQLPHPADVRSELYAAWRPATALPLLHSLACRLAQCELDAPPYLPVSPQVIDWQFRALAGLPGSSSAPMFVFAHVLVPHEPYVYGPDCEHRRAFWPKDDQHQRERIRRAYLDQIQCLNAKLLPLIDTLRARSRVPPVIILQSDHGHGRLGRDLPPLVEVSPEAVLERISVFAAYFLPGVPVDSVPDTISPVSATRLVLRQYFRADLPVLPEATFWSSATQPYLFEPVVDAMTLGAGRDD